MIAIHGGVGYKPSAEKARLCAQALEPVAGPSRDSKELVSTVEAVCRLEASPEFNCGFGSNLTRDGRVECEASFMSSRDSSFASVAAVSRLRHPVLVAKKLADSRKEWSPLVAPLVLVGDGAERFAESRGIELCEPASLVSDIAKRQHEAALASIREESVSFPMDTVGALSIFPFDQGIEAQAASSSGGITLKLSGRLGPCGIPGASVWVEEDEERMRVAMCATGCGEALLLTDFSRSLCRAVLRDTEERPAGEIVDSWFRRDFLESHALTAIDEQRRVAGGLLLIYSEGRHELVVFHNAPTLPIAFQRAGERPKRLVSTLPRGALLKCDSFLT